MFTGLTEGIQPYGCSELKSLSLWVMSNLKEGKTL